MPAADQEIVRRLRAIMDATGASYADVAPAMRTSPSTVRRALETDQLPERADARVKFATFVQRNADARQRSDLRFI
jgi:hypothetical protein